MSRGTDASDASDASDLEAVTEPLLALGVPGPLVGRRGAVEFRHGVGLPAEQPHHFRLRQPVRIEYRCETGQIVNGTTQKVWAVL